MGIPTFKKIQEINKARQTARNSCMKKEASGYITVSKIHGFRKNNIRKYIILIKSIRVNFKADQSTSNLTNCRVHENMFSTTTDAYLKP